MNYHPVNSALSGAWSWRQLFFRRIDLGLALVSFLMLAGGVSANDDVSAYAKIALVIGNGAYHQSPLKNPVADANSVAAALRSLGFHVIQRENATQSEMLDAIREFSHEASQSKVRVLFYAGHGAQIRGRNYLMPVDTVAQTEEELILRAADVSELLERLSGIREGINLIILDACRNNPFVLPIAQLADQRGYRVRALGAAAPAVPPPPGLAPLNAPSGTMVAFSTAPGSVSIDSAAQGNSVYTKHLLAYLNVPGLPVEKLFKQVRMAVARETRQQQVPWESSSLIGEFCFKKDIFGRCSG